MTYKKKIPCWLSILLLTGLGILVSPHQVLTRTDEVSRALSPILSSYEVIRMAPGESERQVRTTGELRFRFNETDFYFNLEPHDMRAPNYRAVATGPGGVRRTLPSQPVHTFKGVLAGREDTRGRFNLTDGGVEGVVYAPEGWVYVEPLRNYLPSAPAGELVVYSHADIKPGEPLKCGVSLPQRLQRGMKRVKAQVEAATPTKYEFDIATEADYEYVQALGGSENANLEIEGILNQVEGVYQSELLLQLQITFQHAWDMEKDPYTTANASDLLDEFIGYWNAHYAATQTYDLAHLWTGMDLEDGIAGLAELGVVCNARSYSYALSSHGTTVPQKYTTPAHEIGHNFGASHPNEQDPPIAGCTNTIMANYSLFRQDLDGSLTFCEFSRQEIQTHVAGNHSCMTAQPITLQPATGLAATAVSTSAVDLTWRDNSSNETGFIVQMRLGDSVEWSEIGTTVADISMFSSEGLSPGFTYRYRVRAFNDTESSAFSNEAVATTQAGSQTGDEWRIDTVAGGDIGDGGPAVQALITFPYGVAADRNGNLYIVENSRHRIRKVDAEGTITTIAGTGEGGYSGDGGPAVQAQLRWPIGVAVDNDGNVYIADQGNDRIRRVDALGNITTIAARLNTPKGVTVDGVGNLFIADTENHRIRRADPSGTITTIAGTGVRGYSGDGGPAVQAQLNFPRGVAVDGSGNLYIADRGNDRIRRVDPSGTITTIAGTGVRGYSGDGGPAVQAQLAVPSGVAVDGNGNLYIADEYNSRIRRVDDSGTITTIAGGGEGGSNGDGGPAHMAKLSSPQDVAVDSAGNLYIADYGNARIRRVDHNGTITTVAGSGFGSYGGDNGLAVQAQLARPRGMVLDSNGNLFIADTGNHRIRRVDASGTITTIAGTGEDGYSGDGGLAVEAQLNEPRGVAVDGSGNLYIVDRYNNRIRRIDATGIITTIAGTGRDGYSGDGGPATQARLDSPSSLAVDNAGNLYIADRGNNSIRRVDASGTITRVAGNGSGSWGYSGDGGPAVAAQLGDPNDVVVDSAGNFYIVERANSRIRRVDAAGIITTVAGNGKRGHSGDGGPAVAARLNGPTGVAVDGAGNLYIADQNESRIRRVDARGIITTIAGTGRADYTGDGGPAVEAYLNRPQRVAVDGSGNVYLSDTENHRIRVLTQPPRPPNSPTLLKATAVSFYEINLAWQDNSTNETGFRVQRRLDGSDVWIEIGATAANATRFSDVGLVPTTTYRYRVRAFVHPVASDFSNEAQATTLEVPSPTLTHFTPTSGSVGTRVTLTGSGFLGAAAVAFNEVPASHFEVHSETSIEAIVPLDATSGPISVVTPGGTAVSSATFTVSHPTVARFTPASGPAGTRVTLTGTGFLGATAVKFNGVDASSFEVHSGMSIEAVVPAAATSGPISVETPGGTAVSADRFTVTVGGTSSRLFVPIVLRSQGRTAGSFFTSELTLTNRGSTIADIHYTYTAFGGGSGAAMDSLEPGRQRVIPDAIAHLTALGVPIGSGSASGTLAVDFSNLSSPSDAAVTVRITTPVEEGRAGLAFPGLNPDGLLTGPAFITGLRQNSQDRSNVAVQNAGVAGEGSITLRVTVYSGNPASAVRSVALSDRTLPPGGFYQYNGILNTAGFDNGYVKVERVSGTAPYYAYGVINDNFNSDGSFVFPVREDSLAGKRGQTLPVIIETGAFSSELTVTNFSPVPKTVDFRFVAEAVETDDDTATFSLRLKAGEQRILPQIVDWLRQQEVAGIGAARQAFVGAVFATVAEGDMSGIVIGARTGAPEKRGGQYGLFYNGVPFGSASIESAWIYGLQQNEENRSNLALVNTGEIDDSSSTFEIDIYDGDGSSQPTTKSVTLGPRRWLQMNGILGQRRQGYVEVRKTSGSNPFVTYGVVNDGGAPGERSGDGAYLPAGE